jgi:TorA maturation chaperone TorD
MRATLRAYQVIFGLCGQVFSSNPTHETLASLIGLRALLDDEPFSAIAPAASRHLYEALDEAAQNADKTAELLAAVRHDYTSLFLMVGASHTSPYESVYRTPDRTMFGPTEAEVRKLYKRYGVKPAATRSEPADHFGLELIFASALLAMGSDYALEGLQEIVEEHLLVFAPALLGSIERQAQTTFYRSFARIAMSALKRVEKDIKLPVAA